MLNENMELKGKTKTWYEIYTTENEFGRRGSCVAVVDDYYVAQERAKEEGWWNGKADVDKVMVLELEDGTAYKIKVDEIALSDDDKTKEVITRVKTLGKLSPDERKALGV